MKTQSPRAFTAKSMASFSRIRVNRMTNSALEIAGCYGDVDQGVVEACDFLIAQLKDLKETIDHLETEGKEL